ncbi:YdeI/OmpD-associated family protein [Micromonospora sp. BRA006-A]|nr:YdeI/OmpD-associated family protein [Micromonospora sp. BRA006-A]
MSETFGGTLVCEQVGAWTCHRPARDRRPAGHRGADPGDRPDQRHAVRRLGDDRAERQPVHRGQQDRTSRRRSGGGRRRARHPGTGHRGAHRGGARRPDRRAGDHPDAQAFFATLSCSRTKEYVTWITGAKRPETGPGGSPRPSSCSVPAGCSRADAGDRRAAQVARSGETPAFLRSAYAFRPRTAARDAPDPDSRTPIGATPAATGDQWCLSAAR